MIGAAGRSNPVGDPFLPTLSSCGQAVMRDLESFSCQVNLERTPFRPDTRRNREGLGSSLGVRLRRIPSSASKSSPAGSGAGATCVVPGSSGASLTREGELLRRHHQGERRGRPSASEAVPRTLRGVVEAFPYAIHTVLTDNGMAFADLPRYRDGPTARWMGHIFDRVCRENGIGHRLTKPYHPWTDGQAERMNRTVKDATIKAFHYPGLEALKAHLLAFVRAYNFARPRKALRWRPPFQAIRDAWTKDRSRFKINPHHLIPGPNSYSAAEKVRLFEETT